MSGMLLAEWATDSPFANGQSAFTDDARLKSANVVKSARRITFMNENALAEQNNDEIERRARRRSRLLEPHPEVVNSPSHDAARRANATTTHFMPRAEVGEHYGNCIRLAAENKITYKNAFDLHLIDFMGEMIKKEDFTSFRMASSSLDASAKIYAGRVDAVHQETYKVLTGLGRSDSKKSPPTDADARDPDDEDDQLDNVDGDSKTKTKDKKRPATSKNVIVTSLSKIRAKVKASDADVDPLFQQQAVAYDEGGTVELRLNRLRTHSKYSELLQDSHTPLFRQSDGSLTCFTRPYNVSGHILSRYLEEPLSFTFDNFSFLNPTQQEADAAPLSPIFARDNTSVGSVTPTPMASPPFLPDDDDDDVGPMEVTKVEEQEQVAHYASEPTSKAAAVSEQSSVNGDGEVFVSSLKSMLSTHLENFGQINDGILGLWAGPEHWRKKAKRRRLDEFGNVACQPEGEGEVVEMGRSTRSKVAKKKLLRIDYSNALLTAGENRAKSGLLVRSDWSKQLAGFSAKSTKSALLKEQNRRLASEKFNVLPPAICDARKHLYELCNRDVMQASHPKKTPEEAVPPWLDGQVPNANGTEYMTLDDVTRLNDVDGGCVDDDDDDNDAPFCGIFTQNIMWNMIDAALPDPEACPEGSQLPVKATKLAQSAVVDGTDIVAAASPLCDFGQILTALPGRVSRNTAEELSVAITLNCLLHLANEKDLMFEPMEDFTNLAIYRGLTDSELELLKEYEKAVRSERRRDKQLSLDAWLEADD
ncbi:unnamed protein product [Schistocephalus solidus]|uniref:Condensin complex subunit 2 n=1 Tax=Schistocephalus solidus TaxID=70667 RepID=A0A3P7E5W7_SCHSO|nr:unnamed protein product [Schistocephalus solidus]